MHIIDVSENVALSLALPLRYVGTYTGSALPIGVRGMPETFAGAAVTSVSLTLTNADGTSITAQCTHQGDLYVALFAASFFSAYGYISKGVKVCASVLDSGSVRSVTVGVGDLDVVADTPDVRRGDPDKTVQGKGDDVYLKSFQVDGTQHYKMMEISYNERVGWGYDLTGDYILVDGEFREAN